MLQIVAKNKTIPPKTIFSKWIKKLSQYINIKENNITLRVVEVAEIQLLNNQFRGKDSPTNVLSFPSQLPESIDDQYLGDIIICADIVEQEACAQNKSTEAHWAHMLVHGILHLQGYDHIEDKQARDMESLEINLLAKLGHPDPYET